MTGKSVGAVIPAQPAGLSPESIATGRCSLTAGRRQRREQPSTVVMDSGLALRAPRNDEQKLFRDDCPVGNGNPFASLNGFVCENEYRRRYRQSERMRRPEVH